MPRKFIDDGDLDRGKRLKKLRESMGLNQSKLGELAGGFPQNSVSNWEKRGLPIPNKALASLHKSGIDIIRLLIGDEVES